MLTFKPFFIYIPKEISDAKVGNHPHISIKEKNLQDSGLKKTFTKSNHSK